MPKTKKIIILGIDPGLADTGYGLIGKEDNLLKIISCGCIRTNKQKTFPLRLQKISQELTKVIKKYKPDRVAVEELFFCKNLKTALKVGQAKGVILLTCQNNKLPIEEFTPLQVKQALVGYGHASKQQIQYMVKTILNLKKTPKPDDAADALAVAICCANSFLNKH